MKAHGCSLLLEGAQRAASKRLRKTSGAISFWAKARGLQRARRRSRIGYSVGARFCMLALRENLENDLVDQRFCPDWGAVAAPQPGKTGKDSAYFGAFLVISRSIVMFTSSPTTTPPPSMLAFHLTP